MDIKTFINEKIKENQERLDNYVDPIDEEILYHDLCGQITAYENVLEFLEKRKGNKEYINDFMQSLSILSTSPEYEKIENLFTEMDLEIDLQTHKIFNLEFELNEQRVINSMRLSTNGTNENYFREGK